MKVAIKLEKDTLVLKFDTERTFQEQKDETESYLLSMKSFFSKGDVKFSYDGCTLSFDEELELSSIVDSIFEREVEFCHKMRAPEWMLRHVTSNGEVLAKKVFGTVRGGETVESNGDLIVIGDVNPTAQLFAQGDIYVIGNLRGVAHAGCQGREKSVIYAMNMNPVMLKIADKIGFNPDSTKDNQNGIALVENGEIQVKMI